MDIGGACLIPSAGNVRATGVLARHDVRTISYLYYQRACQAGKLRAELLAAHAERDDMATRLRDADAAAAALEADAAAQAGALGASLQAQGRELAAAAAAAQRGQQDKVRGAGGAWCGRLGRGARPRCITPPTLHCLLEGLPGCLELLMDCCARAPCCVAGAAAARGAGAAQGARRGRGGGEGGARPGRGGGRAGGARTAAPMCGARVKGGPSAKGRASQRDLHERRLHDLRGRAVLGPAAQCAAEAEARRVAEVELDEARAQIDFMRESKVRAAPGRDGWRGRRGRRGWPAPAAGALVRVARKRLLASGSSVARIRVADGKS